MPLRKVKAGQIGSLVTLKGIVTRVSEVKPNIEIATYTCQKGGAEVYQEVVKRDFMPLFTCPPMRSNLSPAPTPTPAPHPSPQP